MPLGNKERIHNFFFTCSDAKKTMQKKPCLKFPLPLAGETLPWT
jgi:hypothetical protein